jgi:hypothetical protein
MLNSSNNQFNNTPSWLKVAQKRFLIPFGVLLTLASVVIFALEFIHVLSTVPAVVLYIGCGGAYIAVWSWFILLNPSTLKYYINIAIFYIFSLSFVSLIVIGLINFPYLNAYQEPLFLIALISLFFVIFDQRIFLRHSLEKEKNEENIREQQRSEEFKIKFPRVSTVPIIGTISKKIYKEGLFCSLALGLLIISSVCILNYRLGSSNFNNDEFLVVDAAVGYNHTGTFWRWDWLNERTSQGEPCLDITSTCHYVRAWPDTLLVALSFKLFGVSEWSARIVSVLFGILFVPIAYIVTKFFSDSKRIALLTTFAVTFNPALIELFRFTRMYSVLIPLFLLLLYQLYKALSQSSKFALPKNLSFIERYLDFNYMGVFLAAILLIVSVLLQLDTLVISLPILIFILYLSVFDRKPKYFVILGFAALVCIFVVIFYQNQYIQQIFEFLTFFQLRNYGYYGLLLSYPFQTWAATILLLLGLGSSILMGKELRDKMLYLILCVTAALAFYIWIGNRYVDFTYVCHLATVAIILMTLAYYLLIKISPKPLALLWYIVFIVCILINFFLSTQEIYFNPKQQQFSTAYAIINQEFDPQNQALFAVYLRPYYLPNLQGKNVQSVDMLSNRQYTYAQFLTDLSKYQSGWITWETQKTYHLDPNIVAFIEEHFEEVHGKGLDNTNVQVYYFNQSMM